jgi:acetoin utilization protein AcuC
MKRRTAFLYTDDFLSYTLGDKHPLQQRRLQMVDRLLDAYGVFQSDEIKRIAPTMVDEALLAKVHTTDYLNAVQRASSGEFGAWLGKFGLGNGDTPAFLNMWPASKLYAGGTVDAANLVLSKNYDIAFNVAGGLHHAHPWKASGFCVFNDLALGIHTLLEAGLKRVAYIDIDAHHGDGVQVCHWDDPRVLTISLHESGRWLYPGTGFPSETGGPNAPNSAINLPFAPQTNDVIWWDAFEAIVPEALDRFAPEALVLQIGADAHFGDPLAHLNLTSGLWMQAVERLLELGQSVPIIVTGGGGYNIATVARLWTMVTAACAGITLPNAVPEAYAAQYGITTLHDQTKPTISASQLDAAATYATEQVSQLRAELGWEC